MTVLRVPYHLDEYLPDLELPLAPARPGPPQTGARIAPSLTDVLVNL